MLCSSAALPYQWNGVGRVVAVGDVHGDFSRFVEILRDAGLVDNSKNWCGGKTHLVQTGDIPDRGPDSRLVMDLLIRLEEQAPLQGGAIHCLIGNHEAMMVTGDLRYVHPGEAASHRGMKKLVRSFRTGGQYGRWISGNNSVVMINNMVFVHGGISEQYSSWPLSRINEEVGKSLLQEQPGSILGGDGPLWFRGWADSPATSVERALEEFLHTAGANFAVIGHTVVIDGVETRFGGRVVMIDTGLSEHYGGPGQYLVMDDSGWKAVTP